jgi:K+-sensing histidine kinase KdpD
MLNSLDNFNKQIAFLFDPNYNLLFKTVEADQYLCSQFSPLNLLQIVKNNLIQKIPELEQSETKITGFTLQDYRLKQDDLNAKLVNFSIYQFIDKNYLLIESYKSQTVNQSLSSLSGLDIIAGATHDLKNPMSAIFGFADTLLVGLEQDSSQISTGEIKNIVSTITNTSRRAIDLLRNYEQLFLMINHQIQPKLQDCNLLTYIKQEITNNPTAQNRITIECHTKNLTVMMHGIHLERVLANLIQNAIKFSTDKDKIEIIINETPSGLELNIKNAGSFIPETDYELIFKKYERLLMPEARVNKTEKYVKGTGLGLYIVDNILKAYSYKIKVSSHSSESARDSYTNFCVVFTTVKKT